MNALPDVKFKDIGKLKNIFSKAANPSPLAFKTVFSSDAEIPVLRSNGDFTIKNFNYQNISYIAQIDLEKNQETGDYYPTVNMTEDCNTSTPVHMNGEKDFERLYLLVKSDGQSFLTNVYAPDILESFKSYNETDVKRDIEKCYLNTGHYGEAKEEASKLFTSHIVLNAYEDRLDQTTPVAIRDFRWIDISGTEEINWESDYLSDNPEVAERLVHLRDQAVNPQDLPASVVRLKNGQTFIVHETINDIRHARKDAEHTRGRDLAKFNKNIRTASEGYQRQLQPQQAPQTRPVEVAVMDR